VKEKKGTGLHLKIKPGETKYTREGIEITNEGNVNARIRINTMAGSQTEKKVVNHESAE
jgi:hypothetical protein